MTTELKARFKKVKYATDDLYEALTDLMSHFEEDENIHDMATVEDRRFDLERLSDELLDASAYLNFKVEQILDDLDD